MRCDRVRKQIQNWFDTPGSPAMPDSIREHVRKCVPCRVLITRWNAIELQIQSLREHTPNLSPDFTYSLQARLRVEAAGIRRPWIARYWRLTLAGASTAAIMFFLALHLLGGTHPPTNAPPLAAVRNSPTIQKENSPASLSSGLPLANTR
jgi:hypothetical protein